MTLTDDERKTLIEALIAKDNWTRVILSSRDEVAYQTGFAAGRTASEAAIREGCAKICEDYSAEQWARYKRGDQHDHKSGRADPHVQGLSCGADECAGLIRASWWMSE